MQRFLNVILASMVMVIGFGCQPSPKAPQGKKPAVVRLNIKEEPQSLDPRKARTLNSLSIIHMLFDGLMREGKEGKPELAVAQRIETSADLKTYTFHLRETTWSNGDRVKSTDFAYAWKKILSPDFPSDVASALYVIKNAKQAREGILPVQEIAIFTPDENTLVVELEQPTPYFLALVSQTVFSPVNQRIDEENPQWMQQADSYVSNGPFSLSGWKHQDQLLLKKNLHYWDASSVHIDSLQLEMLAEETEFNLFEKQELDWAGSPLSELPLEALKGLKEQNLLHTKTGLGTAFLRTNTQTRFLSNLSLRKALALAINRQAIVEHVTQGGQLPATALVPEFFHLQTESYFQDGDLQTAKTLFAQALKELNVSKEALSEMTYLYRACERNHLIAQTIQQQWVEAFGVRIKLEAVEGKVFFSRISKQDYQIAYGNWIGDFSDPINFLEVFKYKGEGSNNTHWENPEYISLLSRSSQVPAGEQRQALLAQAEKILIQEMPIIPLYYMNMLYVSQSHLKDVVLSSGGQIDFKWASIEDVR